MYANRRRRPNIARVTILAITLRSFRAHSPFFLPFFFLPPLKSGRKSTILPKLVQRRRIVVGSYSEGNPSRLTEENDESNRQPFFFFFFSPHIHAYGKYFITRTARCCIAYLRLFYNEKYHLSSRRRSGLRTK